MQKIYTGDSLRVLKKLPTGSVDCVITSPPYYGLRDYGVHGQLGNEQTQWQYLENLLRVFREVHRVLKPEGTCWVNIGDTYGNGLKGKGSQGKNSYIRNAPKIIDTGPHKELLMIPARFAIEMRNIGWMLRQEIIWAKPNPMPESVKDRCTRAHEFIYMFTKQKKYFYDAEAIKTPSKEPKDDRGSRGGQKRKPTERINGIRSSGVYPMANKRSVWTVNTRPYKEAHFAVFPEKLVEDPIKAGCPKGGTVLDPFMGSGTVLVVAEREGRNSIGIELSREYVEIAKRRVKAARNVMS